MKHKWNCLPNCGWCCGSHVKFTRDILERRKKDFVVVPDIIFVNNDGTVQIGTEDSMCVWMNRETKRCTIYTDRPIGCRLYGIHPKHPCPFVDLKGNKRPDAQIEEHKKKVLGMVKFAVNYCMPRKEKNHGSKTEIGETEKQSENQPK